MAASRLMKRPIRNAVLWLLRDGHSDLRSRVQVTTRGDDCGVTIAMCKGDEAWELQLSAAEARGLVFGLHRSVLDALEAEAANDGRHGHG